MKSAIILSFLGLLVVALPAKAEVFHYQDREGRSHFVDSLEKIPSEYRKEAESSDSFPPLSRVEPGREQLYNARQNTTAPDVEVFVTEWCPHSRKLEAFLKQQGVRYKRYDIERDPRGEKLHAQLGSGVPIIRIGATVIRGFQPAQIRAALGAK